MPNNSSASSLQSFDSDFQLSRLDPAEVARHRQQSMPSLGALNADAFRRLAEHLSLRDRILELRLVSKTCHKQLAQMGTECLTLKLSGVMTRWSESDTIRCAGPLGSIRHFGVRSLKLEELKNLEVAVLQGLLKDAKESMISLAVSGWCPNLKIETSQGFLAARSAMYSTCAAWCEGNQRAEVVQP